MPTVLALSLLLLLAASRAEAEEPVLRIHGLGRVRGVVEGEGTWVFRGIPYAQKPLGALRWSPPEPVQPWEADDSTSGEPFDATKWGHSCHSALPPTSFMYSANEESEDCLTINVWVPASVRRAKQLVPVMTFIHGGGFQMGSSSHPLASPNPIKFAELGGVVFVSFNYRLGPFGFMAHPSLNQTFVNVGLLDQVLALKFMQDHLADFHGNKSMVTVMGSSAGAFSLCFMLASPIARGLFHRAVMQSVLCDFQFAPLENATRVGVRLAEQLGCNKGSAYEQRSCLQEAPAEAVRNALQPMRGLVWSVQGGKTVRWFPVIGDPFAPVHPVLAIRAGNFQKDVDIVVGNNANEASLFMLLGFPMYTPTEFVLDVTRKTFGPALYEEVLEHYGRNITARQLVVRTLSDLWTCSSHRLVRDFNKGGARSARLYYFNQIPSWVPWIIRDLGAMHGADLHFVFDSLSSIGTFTTAEANMARMLRETWTALAKHELHAVTGKWQLNEQYQWPAYPGEEAFGDEVLTLHADGFTLGARPAVCDLWDRAVDPRNGLLRDPGDQQEPYMSYVFNQLLPTHVRGHIRQPAMLLSLLAMLLALAWYRGCCCGRRSKGAKGAAGKQQEVSVDAGGMLGAARVQRVGRARSKSPATKQKL